MYSGARSLVIQYFPSSKVYKSFKFTNPLVIYESTQLAHINNCMSLYKFAYLNVEGLPYTEFDYHIYYIDTYEGLELAKHIPCNTRKRIFTVLPGVKYDEVLATQPKSVKSIMLSLEKLRGKGLILGSIVQSGVDKFVIDGRAKLPDKQPVVSDSVYMLNIMPYTNYIANTNSRAYLGVSYAAKYPSNTVAQNLGVTHITIPINFPQMNWNPFSALISYYEGDKNIKPEILALGTSYPLPYDYCEILYHWIGVNLPVFPLLCLSCFAVTNLPLSLGNNKPNKYKGKTPIQTSCNIMNDIIETTKGSFNNPELVGIFEYGNLQPTSMRSIWAMIMSLANDNALLIGKFDGELFESRLSTLLDSMDMPVETINTPFLPADEVPAGYRLPITSQYIIKLKSHEQ